MNGECLSRNLSRRWRELCSQYLPIRCNESFWAYSREARSDEPSQGWKLHVSATVLTACDVLQKLAPFLRHFDVQFKTPNSLSEVQRINSGVYYGYSQVGKLITIYPNSTEAALHVAEKSHEITKSMRAPAVPFDGKFRQGGCVYYRYGAFKPLRIAVDGRKVPAILDPAGTLVPDQRGSAVHPDWVTNPFDIEELPKPEQLFESPLRTKFGIFSALSQRGRGGVYQALDFSSIPPRFCIVKEGRTLGEVGWDGRDGSWRVKHEERVIMSLRMVGIPAPEIYSSFSLHGNYYLVTELIEGETLNNFLLRRRRRLPVGRAIQLGEKIAVLLTRIHAAGWTWRDCKPGNLLITRKGMIRPVDFEGACPAAAPDSSYWGTQGFTPPVWRSHVKSREYEDLYALGSMLYLLLTGRLPQAKPIPVTNLRVGVPTKACRLITDLLSANARTQPSAQIAAAKLANILKDSRQEKPSLRGYGN